MSGEGRKKISPEQNKLRDMFRKHLKKSEGKKEKLRKKGTAEADEEKEEFEVVMNARPAKTSFQNKHKLKWKHEVENESKTNRQRDNEEEEFENEKNARPAATKMRKAKLKWKKDEKEKEKEETSENSVMQDDQKTSAPERTPKSGSTPTDGKSISKAADEDSDSDFSTSPKFDDSSEPLKDRLVELERQNAIMKKTIARLRDRLGRRESKIKFLKSKLLAAASVTKSEATIVEDDEKVDEKLLAQAERVLHIIRRNQLFERALSVQETNLMVKFFEGGAAKPNTTIVLLLDRAIGQAMEFITRRPDLCDEIVDASFREFMVNSSRAKKIILDVMLIRPEFLPSSWKGNWKAGEKDKAADKSQMKKDSKDKEKPESPNDNAPPPPNMDPTQKESVWNRIWPFGNGHGEETVDPDKTIKKDGKEKEEKTAKQDPNAKKDKDEMGMSMGKGPRKKKKNSTPGAPKATRSLMLPPTTESPPPQVQPGFQAFQQQTKK